MKVELVSYTHNPVMVIAKAASTCYRSNVDTPEKAEKLVEKCIARGHHSVLEFADFHFHVEGISRACSHQLVRHRLASFAQESQRFVAQEEMKFVVPQSLKMNVDARASFYDCIGHINDCYNSLISTFNIPQEDARYILPNACITAIDVKMNYRELMHFCGERLCGKAQDEICELAKCMSEIVASVSPLLGYNLVPKCDRLGRCPEENSCKAALQ